MRSLVATVLLASTLLASVVGHANAEQPSCKLGQVFTVVGSGLLAVKTPVVQDGLSVLGDVQKLGSLPIQYGDVLNAGVDTGKVRKYLGPGAMWVYFPANAKQPSTLLWLDGDGICQGNSPVVRSTEFPGWSFAEMKHWGYMLLPPYLVVGDALCIRPRNMHVVHVPELTGGDFKGVPGVPGVVCSYPGQVAKSMAAGHGVSFTFIAAIR